MISKEKKNTLHIASCSFGKDSLATILLALEHGEPLDEAVYCEASSHERCGCGALRAGARPGAAGCRSTSAT